MKNPVKQLYQMQFLLLMVFFSVCKVGIGSSTDQLLQEWPESRAVVAGDMAKGAQGQEDKDTQLSKTDEELSTKLLSSLQGIFSFVGSTGVHLLFPLVLVFTLYLGLMLWVSSTLHQADHHLYSTISELNAKTDQISEGIAALAQIYIDNYPFTYRSRHDALQGSMGAIVRQSKKSSRTPA